MSTDNTATTKVEEVQVDESLRGLIDAGVFYGRKKSRTHPKMKDAILSNRNGIEIINLEKTKIGLEKALAFLAEKARQGGTIMFVGTQPQAGEVASVGAELQMPYIDSRWLGGTLTNNKVILSRIDYYKKLKHDFEHNLLEKYTKKERLMMEKELIRMKEFMAGLEAYTSLPQVLVVVDPQVHSIAVHEARHMHIPVVAFINTDGDPDLINYPVIGNTKARTSVSWFLGNVKDTIKAARLSMPAAAPQEKQIPSQES